MKHDVEVRHLDRQSGRYESKVYVVDAEGGDDAANAALLKVIEDGLVSIMVVSIAPSAAIAATVEPPEAAVVPSVAAVEGKQAEKPAAKPKPTKVAKPTKIRAANPILADLDEEAEPAPQKDVVIALEGVAGESGADLG